MKRQFEAAQANLFHPRRVRPAWSSLPVETREEVTKLVARMLKQERARRVAPASATEGEVQNEGHPGNAGIDQSAVAEP